jgi:hypothetical protein
MSVYCWQHFDSWPRKYPLCVHAESQTTAAVLLLATLHNRPIHICHVARKEEIQIIRAAKEKVCFLPHFKKLCNVAYAVTQTQLYSHEIQHSLTVCLQQDSLRNMLQGSDTVATQYVHVMLATVQFRIVCLLASCSET